MPPDIWTPQAADYLDALAGQNPWHDSGTVPSVFSPKVRRPLAKSLWKSLIERPERFQLVLGPRRVGKTVAMYQTVDALISHGIGPKRLCFMRMDHPLFQHHPLGGWVKALLNNQGADTENPLYLFLDEINYADDWDKWLKTFFDERWPVRVVATSSSSAALQNQGVESGIGRWSTQYLTPYSFGEYLDLFHTKHSTPSDSSATLFDDMSEATSWMAQTSLSADRKLFSLIGGFPELLLRDFDQNDPDSSILRSQLALRQEAIQRVTGMDLPQAFNVRQPILLERLLYTLAGQICGLVSPTGLAKDLGANHQTINQYIDYLCKAYLIFTLPNYSGNELAVQRRGRKVYFVDGAARNAALQRGLKPAEDPREMGVLVENLVASHLFMISLQNDIRLFHWRDSRKNEVDFIYDDPRGPVAIEVTSASKHTLKGLRALQEKHDVFRGRCYLVSAASPRQQRPDESTDGIGRLPLEQFLLAASSRSARALADRMAGT